MADDVPPNRDSIGARPHSDALHAQAESWRSDAETLRAHGQDDVAEVCERHADELQDAFARWWSEPLTVAEAAEWSDYSEDRLRALAREGRLPSQKDRGRIRIPRCALPRKAGEEGPAVEVGREEEGPVGSRSQMARAVVHSD